MSPVSLPHALNSPDFHPCPLFQTWRDPGENDKPLCTTEGDVVHRVGIQHYGYTRIKYFTHRFQPNIAWLTTNSNTRFQHIGKYVASHPPPSAKDTSLERRAFCVCNHLTLTHDFKECAKTNNCPVCVEPKNTPKNANLGANLAADGCG